MTAIIDAHVHVTQSGQWFNTRHNASVDELLKQMDEAGINQTVLLPLEADCPNSFAAGLCDKYPGRFITFANVSNLFHPNCIKQLEADLDSFPLKGIKLHSRIHQFSPTDHHVLLPVLELARNHKLPVLFDVFPYGPTPIQNQLPWAYETIARLVPEVDIILAHTAGHRVLDMLDIAKASGNIYLDISFSLMYYKNLSRFREELLFMVQKLGANRVIYGSDFPEVNMKESLETARLILQDLSPEEQQLVFGGTIQKLLSKTPVLV